MGTRYRYKRSSLFDGAERVNFDAGWGSQRRLVSHVTPTVSSGAVHFEGVSRYEGRLRMDDICI